MRRARWFALLATFVVAGLAATVLDGFLGHTDDGCPVEIHCLVCQRAHGATPAMPRIALLPMSFEVVGAPAVATLPCVSAPAVRAAVSRGPPPTPASAQA